MSSVTVFVDDAVRGNLPSVCAKTGAPARKVMRIDQDLTGSLGALWLLVFFGPPGWVLFAVLAASRRRQHLVVRVPYADEMIRRYHAARRLTFRVAAGAGALLVAAFVLPFLFSTFPQGLDLAAGLFVLSGGLVAVLVCSWRAQRLLVGVDLDASGRWVTLKHVHPDFAAACEAVDRGTPVARPIPR
ncbi:hypothetical protein [Aquihabitans sp. McL0605]|uniref:hypothetical protein n=1 Tax=Aquihabitans sp. McL0605 TaxID=3415671 RepID=UPI003CEE401C